MPNDSREAHATAALAAALQRVIRTVAGVGADRYVCFLDGGLALDPGHMTWLAQGAPFSPGGGPDEGRADEAAWFARLADTIPAVGRPWSESKHRVGPMFRAWLDAAVVADGGLAPEEARRLSEAAEAIRGGAEAYRAHEQAWRQASVALQERLRVRGGGPEHVEQVLEARRASEAALQAWKARGGKARFETAMATHAQLSSRGMGRAMEALRERYDEVLRANRTLSGEPFAPVDLAPRDLFAGEGYRPVVLRAGDRPELAPSAMYGGHEVPLFWIRNRHGPHISIGELDPARLSLSFELAYARVDRSAWFDSAILTSRSWWWKEDGARFSDGAPPPHTRGEWQMIPTGVVLVRELIVDLGRHGAAASELARHARAAAAAGCWIFGVRNVVATPVSDGHDVALLDRGRLAAPHVQLVAVVCQLMPREPDPDPAR